MEKLVVYFNRHYSLCRQKLIVVTMTHLQCSILLFAIINDNADEKESSSILFLSFEKLIQLSKH